jgi:hypothetical protein
MTMSNILKALDDTNGATRAVLHGKSLYHPTIHPAGLVYAIPGREIGITADLDVGMYVWSHVEHAWFPIVK